MSSTIGDLGDPAGNYFPVAPSDAADLPMVPQAFYIGVSGDLTLHDLDGTQVTFVGVPQGAVLPVRARRVLSTGTTAAAIVALI